jgi:hypothetical protein
VLVGAIGLFGFRKLSKLRTKLTNEPELELGAVFSTTMTPARWSNLRILALPALGKRIVRDFANRFDHALLMGTNLSMSLSETSLCLRRQFPLHAAKRDAAGNRDIGN